jgi:hypothetical protein
VNGTSGNHDRVPRTEHRFLAFEDDPEGPRDDCVNLVYTVCVFLKGSAGSVDIPRHRVATPFKACPQNRLADWSIPAFVPTFYVYHHT